MKRLEKIICGMCAIMIMASCAGDYRDFDACGQINATEIVVSAEMAGNLDEFDVEEGDKLMAGQQVGCIDTVQTYLKIKELQRRREGAAIKKVDIDCQIRSQYDKLENLKTDLERYKDLLKKDAGTQKQVDDLSYEIKILESQIRASEQTYRQNNESLDNEVNTLDVQIAQAEDQLDKCRIKSPADGTVLTKYAEKGEQVSSGKPVFKIADMDNVYVKAYFTTAQLAGLKLGDTVTVYPDDGSSELPSYQGTVTWISDEAEFTPKNIQTRDERADLVYAVKIALKNDGRLRLGMYAYVKTNHAG